MLLAAGGTEYVWTAGKVGVGSLPVRLTYLLGRPSPAGLSITRHGAASSGRSHSS